MDAGNDPPATISAISFLTSAKLMCVPPRGYLARKVATRRDLHETRPGSAAHMNRENGPDSAMRPTVLSCAAYVTDSESRHARFRRRLQKDERGGVAHRLVAGLSGPRSSDHPNAVSAVCTYPDDLAKFPLMIAEAKLSCAAQFSSFLRQRMSRSRNRL